MALRPVFAALNNAVDKLTKGRNRLSFCFLPSASLQRAANTGLRAIFWKIFQNNSSEYLSQLLIDQFENLGITKFDKKRFLANRKQLMGTVNFSPLTF